MGRKFFCLFMYKKNSEIKKEIIKTKNETPETPKIGTIKFRKLNPTKLFPKANQGENGKNSPCKYSMARTNAKKEITPRNQPNLIKAKRANKKVMAQTMVKEPTAKA